MAKGEGAGKGTRNGGQENGVPHLDGARKKHLQELAGSEGTPIFVIDHGKIRENYRIFHDLFPNIQIYYAVKANSNPEIVRTLFQLGCSFDVASMPEFMLVYENIRGMPDKERQDWIWDKIIYANTIKPVETLEALDK
ncbi:MAG: type III PLP-dependent enzyme, partial [Methanomicrobiales archaeon]|nr:type III PLP-dependent enzyme [Methanomicrobiales archaeon]